MKEKHLNGNIGPIEVAYEVGRESRAVIYVVTKDLAKKGFRRLVKKVRETDWEEVAKKTGRIASVAALYMQPLEKVAAKIGPQIASKAPVVLKKGVRYSEKCIHYAKKGFKYVVATSEIIASSQLQRKCEEIL